MILLATCVITLIFLFIYFNLTVKPFIIACHSVKNDMTKKEVAEMMKAFNTLRLESLFLGVNKKNVPAIRLNQSLHFLIVGEDENEYKMVLEKVKIN